MQIIESKAAFDLQIPNKFFVEYEIEQSTSSYWLLCHLEQTVFSRDLQKPPVVLMPCRVVLPADARVVYVPREDHGLQVWHYSCLSIEGLMCLVYVVRWPVANTHFYVTYSYLPFSPNP